MARRTQGTTVVDRRTDVDKLTALRLAKGWTMAELARQSDLAYSYIRKIHAGTHHLGKFAAPNVAAALGCDVEDFTYPAGQDDQPREVA